MARKARDDIYDTVYHVICRGNNGEMILKEEKDKVLYMSILRRYLKKYDIKVYAYCIMDNHVHLLIHRMKDPMNKFMQVVQQTFTQHFNKRYGRKGHVFQQRYKSIPCRKDSYFLELIKYIHLNPVRANFDEGVKYFWSSHRIYSNGLDGGIVDTNYIYSLFANTFKKAIGEYNKFMNQKTDLRCVLYRDYELNREKIQINQNMKMIEDMNIPLSKVIELVSFEYGEGNPRNIKIRGDKKYNQMRKVVIMFTKMLPYISNKELGMALGLAPETITKIRKKTEYKEIENIKIFDKLQEYLL